MALFVSTFKRLIGPDKRNAVQTVCLNAAERKHLRSAARLLHARPRLGYASRTTRLAKRLAFFLPRLLPRLLRSRAVTTARRRPGCRRRRDSAASRRAPPLHLPSAWKPHRTSSLPRALHLAPPLPLEIPKPTRPPAVAELDGGPRGDVSSFFFVSSFVVSHPVRFVRLPKVL